MRWWADERDRYRVGPVRQQKLAAHRVQVAVEAQRVLKSLVTVVLFLCAAGALAAPAVRTDRSNLPITVKSDELSADNRGKVAVFSGKVVARQGDVTIFADKLTVRYGDEKGSVERIEASGNVRIVQQNRTGSADHAVYENSAGRIILTGSPRVSQGGDMISGKSITYFIDEEKSVVSGGEGSRVEAVINPPARSGSAVPR